MKKATLEATDENILQSIKEQKGTERNTEIMEFIKALDLIEENIFISLDARWGEGKTFYVRQIEKTLEYQTLKNFETDDNKNKYEEMKPYFEKTVLEDIELGNSYLPVYYNAWKRWSAFQDNKLWNILTFDYVMRGWKLEELNDQREKNMSSLFDYIVLGNQEGKIKDGSE